MPSPVALGPARRRRDKLHTLVPPSNTGKHCDVGRTSVAMGGRQKGREEVCPRSPEVQASCHIGVGEYIVICWGSSHRINMACLFLEGLFCMMV